jgi:hypothetical protein
MVVTGSGQVRVQQVAERGWIVRSDVQPDSIANVLGCIEQRDEGFELMVVGGDFHWLTFATLGDAVDHLQQRVRSVQPA